MNALKSFVVLEGYLHETMEFEILRGYEAQTFPQESGIPGYDSGITAQLLDDRGEILVVAKPDVAFPNGCSAASFAPGKGILRVKLARHPSARRIELHAHGRIIFGAPVGSEAPTMPALKLEPNEENSLIR